MLVSLALALGLCGVSTLNATTYYWDGNGDTLGAGTMPTGTRTPR